MTNPYTSIYETIFRITMRMVGCNEVANSPELLKTSLKLFETVEKSTTATTMIFPWFPSIALIKRTVAGGRLYMIYKNIVEERKKAGRREEDALQYLLDLGDSVQEIITVSCPIQIISALFQPTDIRMHCSLWSAPSSLVR